MLLTSSIAAYFAQVSKLATQSQSGSRGHRLSSWLWQRYMLRSHPAAFNSQVFRLEAMLESDRLQASLSDHRLHQMLVCPFWGEQVFSNRFYECFWMSDDTGLWWRSFPAHIHRIAGGGIYTCTITSRTEVASTAQAVPKQFQLTFGYTRLQELECFCMLQSTQQLFNCQHSFFFLFSASLTVQDKPDNFWVRSNAGMQLLLHTCGGRVWVGQILNER